CSSIRSQWTPSLRCSSKTNRGMPIADSSPGAAALDPAPLIILQCRRARTNHPRRGGTPRTVTTYRGREGDMGRAQVSDTLNEILRWEYAGLIQYTQFSFVVQGPLREVYYEFFRDNGKEALKHAHRVGDKVVALGGVTSVERAEVKQSLDLNEMLEHSLEM